ncbi:MAG: hypothetical protein PVJ40_02475 [Gammaproteobacteria bacterium]|jgi:vacuolar-type H+-ATPase subunit H
MRGADTGGFEASEAIVRILEAEAAAEADVAAAMEEARDLVARARSEVHGMLARGEARAARVEEGARRQTARQVEAILRTGEQRLRSLQDVPFDEEAASTAAADLALVLTGGTRDGRP